VQASYTDIASYEPNAMLEIDPAAAGKVKLHTQATQGTLLSFDKVGPNKKPAIDLANVPGGVTIGAATTWTLWVEATAPSDSPGDIILTLTGDANGPPAQDIVRATAVAVDLDVDSNNDNRLDTPTATMFLIMLTGLSPRPLGPQNGSRPWSSRFRPACPWPACSLPCRTPRLTRP
jgi:hypothetical protein